MAAPHIPVAPLHASADDAEAQFYESLQQGNLEMMMAIWADEDEVTCVLPGGPRVVGLEALRHVCETMFAQGPVQVVPQQVRRFDSPYCAVHHVLERVLASTPKGPQTAYVLATNVYILTPKGWRLITHHASPTTEQAQQDIVPPTSHLH